MKNKLVTIIIFLAFLTVGLGSYIIYDKLFTTKPIKENNITNDNKINENDIHTENSTNKNISGSYTTLETDPSIVLELYEDNTFTLSHAYPSSGFDVILGEFVIENSSIRLTPLYTMDLGPLIPIDDDLFYNDLTLKIIDANSFSLFAPYIDNENEFTLKRFHFNDVKQNEKLSN